MKLQLIATLFIFIIYGVNNQVTKKIDVVGGCKKVTYQRAISKINVCIQNLFLYKFRPYNLRFQASTICQNQKELENCFKMSFDIECLTKENIADIQRVYNGYKNVTQTMCSNDGIYLKYFFQWREIRCLLNNFDTLQVCLPNNILAYFTPFDDDSKEEICSSVHCLNSTFHKCSKPVSKISNILFNLIGAGYGYGCTTDLISNNADLKDEIEKMNVKNINVGSCKLVQYTEAVNQFKRCLFKIYNFGFNFDILQHFTTATCRHIPEIQVCTDSLVNLQCWTETEGKSWKTSMKMIIDIIKFTCSKNMKLIGLFVNTQGLQCLKDGKVLIESCWSNAISLSMHSASATEEFCSFIDCLKSVLTDCGIKVSRIENFILSHLQTSLRCMHQNNSMTALTRANPVILRSNKQVDIKCPGPKEAKVFDQNCIMDIFHNNSQDLGLIQRTICKNADVLLECYKQLINASCERGFDGTKWIKVIEIVKIYLNDTCSGDEFSKYLSCYDQNIQPLKSCFKMDASGSLYNGITLDTSHLCSAVDCIKYFSKICSMQNDNSLTKHLSGLEEDLNCANLISNNFLSEKLVAEEFIGNCEIKEFLEGSSILVECVQNLCANDCESDTVEDLLKSICQRRMSINRCGKEFLDIECLGPSNVKMFGGLLKKISKIFTQICQKQENGLISTGNSNVLDCLKNVPYDFCFNHFIELVKEFGISDLSINQLSICLESITKSCNSDSIHEFWIQYRAKLANDVQSDSTKKVPNFVIVLLASIYVFKSI